MKVEEAYDILEARLEKIESKLDLVLADFHERNGSKKTIYFASTLTGFAGGLLGTLISLLKSS